ncbi:MAG: helix-turn-helix transcriptional regulator [Deltaproteobacteria bacterium]|nr:helix-turn-helix transcriptional regulator [Deltaproteobacteria bacterium]
MQADDLDFDAYFRAIGARLRARRHKSGLTQEDMIAHGFSARHWQQIEAGRPITVKTLVRACRVFGVTPSTVLRGLEGELD